MSEQTVRVLVTPALPGAPGGDGREVELRTSATHIQWRYTSALSWTDLIALALLQGPQGVAPERTGCVMINPADGSTGNLSAGASKSVIRIPIELNGMRLYNVGACVTTPSSVGPITVQYRRVRAGVSVNMLTTLITIDAGEYDSNTSNSPVIDTANDDVLTGDQIHFDVVTAGTGSLGLVVSFSFQPL